MRQHAALFASVVHFEMPHQGLSASRCSALTTFCLCVLLLLSVLQGLSAQHYHEELAATQQLLALVDPSRVAAPSSQLAAAQGEHGNTAGAYMASVRNLLQMSSSSLADVPGKVVFCRQRISQVRFRVCWLSFVALR
jgi:hypothetical protein